MNTRGKTKVVSHRPRSLPKPDKGKGKKTQFAVPGPPSSSHAVTDEELVSQGGSFKR